MSKWTPGRWAAVFDGEYWNVEDSCGDWVVGNEGLFRCDGQDEANARLIAAAPEMAEVLKEIMSWEENDEMTWGPKARALLDKVNGE